MNIDKKHQAFLLAFLILWVIAWPVYFISITPETSAWLVLSAAIIGLGVGLAYNLLAKEHKPEKAPSDNAGVHMTPGYPPQNRDYMYPHTYDKPLHAVGEAKLDVLYEVIDVTGGNDYRQGGIFKDEFDTFEKAQRYITDHKHLINPYIKMPDGTWWPEDYSSEDELDLRCKMFHQKYLES